MIQLIINHYGKITLGMGILTAIVVGIIEYKYQFFRKFFHSESILVTSIITLAVMLVSFMSMRMYFREDHSLTGNDFGIISSTVALIVSMVALLISRQGTEGQTEN